MYACVCLEEIGHLLSLFTYIFHYFNALIFNLRREIARIKFIVIEFYYIIVEISNIDMILKTLFTEGNRKFIFNL